MNPWNDGDHKDVEWDAECDCGWEGLMEAEAWIPRLDGSASAQWDCPECKHHYDDEISVEDLRW